MMQSTFLGTCMGMGTGTGTGRLLVLILVLVSVLKSGKAACIAAISENNTVVLVLH